MVEEEGPHNEVIDRTASGFRREGTDPNPVPPGVRHAWQRPDLGRGVFRWRPLQVAMAVLCVAILIVSSLWVGGSGRQGQSHIAPLATGLGANSSIADPYLINASMFPAASALPNTTDHSSLPKLAYLNAGTFDLWGLLYVDSDMVGNNWLTFRTGFYNATLAQEVRSEPAVPNPALPLHLSSGTPLSPSTTSATSRSIQLLGDLGIGHGHRRNIAERDLRVGLVRTRLKWNLELPDRDQWCGRGRWKIAIGPCGIRPYDLDVDPTHGYYLEF